MTEGRPGSRSSQTPNHGQKFHVDHSIAPRRKLPWGRVTWVNSQWKLRAQVAHFWVQINIGTNCTGKTAVLQAQARMFSVESSLRKFRASDFHISADEAPDAAPEARKLWIEADFESPELEL